MVDADALLLSGGLGLVVGEAYFRCLLLCASRGKDGVERIWLLVVLRVLRLSNQERGSPGHA